MRQILVKEIEGEIDKALKGELRSGEPNGYRACSTMLVGPTAEYLSVAGFNHTTRRSAETWAIRRANNSVASDRKILADVAKEIYVCW